MLKDFPYAEDGLLVWNAIEEYFDKYLRLYYCDEGSNDKMKASKTTAPAILHTVRIVRASPTESANSNTQANSKKKDSAALGESRLPPRRHVKSGKEQGFAFGKIIGA